MKPFPKIHEALLQKDDGRTALTFALLTKQWVVASDAHIVVRHHTEDLFSKDFIDKIEERRLLVPKAALKACCQKNVIDINLKGTYMELMLRDGAVQQFALSLDGTEAGTYPAWEFLFFDMKDEINPLSQISQIGIDPVLLFRLQKAMGAQYVRMTFYGETRNIIVAPIDEDNRSRGIIMPVISK